MKPSEDLQGGARLKAHATKTIRFASLLAKAGKPEVYLPLTDPKNDKAFMRAVRENRVLSIRQEPTSQQKDFGVVGFDGNKFTTLLIFPKPLIEFFNARVVGIKYDAVGDSFRRSRPRSAVSPKAKVQPSRAKVKLVTSRPSPPKKPELQPKPFRVRVRVTTMKEVTVTALTKSEAKDQARAEFEKDGDVKVVSVRKDEGSSETKSPDTPRSIRAEKS